jgi:hypothetical protein
VSDTPPVADIAAPPEDAAPTPRPRPVGPAVSAAAAALVVALVAVAAAPFWAPPVMQILPWGAVAQKPQAAPAPQVQAPAPAGPDPALAALRGQAAQNAAALQTLNQEVSALAAKPPPDLAPLQQQIAALSGAVGDLTQKIAALDKTAHAAQAAPADETALVLVLLQIDEAVELGRPFDAEYQVLAALALDHPEIAAAAAPLAGPAASGVASRAVLAARLHQLAPQIATAAPPAKPGWRAQIVARLRSLVTIRRIDGAGESPAETAVGAAERDLAGGDLDAAVAAMDGLSGAPLAAAQPWLAMARQRLAVDNALHRIKVLATAELGGVSPTPAKPD